MTADGSSVDEFSEGSLSSPDPGLAVREQQVIELQGQQPAVGSAQRALDRLGVVADQLVGYEAQLSALIAHDPVGDRQGRLGSGDPERGLVGAELADPETPHAAE